MNKNSISGGLVHEVPSDLQSQLIGSDEVFRIWESISPIGRNEFICWIENAKQITTRERRIRRTLEELLDGVKRPCCWAGCIHRTDKKPSSSQQTLLNNLKIRKEHVHSSEKVNH